jgi:phosphoribosylanthranilate isomerase
MRPASGPSPAASWSNASGAIGIKVCGLKSLANALEVAAAGADWIGLNFYPRSPRFIDVALAASIVEALPASTQAVGVFVNRPPAEVREIAGRARLRIVQLHGDEPPADLVALEGLEVIRAFRLDGPESLAGLRSFLDEADRLGAAPAAVLLDAAVPGLRGGTGHLIAESLLDQLPPLARVILSGGLTPENVGARVTRVRPWMVDVASGVESAPGHKDPARVAAFVKAARAAAHVSDFPNCS